MQVASVADTRGPSPESNESRKIVFTQPPSSSPTSHFDNFIITVHIGCANRT